MCNSLTIQLSPKSCDEFLHDLTVAGITYEEIETFNIGEKSKLIQVVESVMDAMPWNTIGKVLIAYIQRDQNNRLIIINADGSSVEAQGLSEKATQKIIRQKTTQSICLFHSTENPTQKQEV